MKITVETNVNSDIDTAWKAWSDPEAIKKWNAASDDWHTTDARSDLREGGTFFSRMEARDGSIGFDFEGTYTRVEPKTLIEYNIADGREVTVEFQETDIGVRVREVFETESTNPPEVQREGWQAILDNFARYVNTLGK